MNSRGARDTVYSSVDQTNIRLKILAIFHEFLSEDQKKRSLFQNFYEIRCESTKITKIRAVNTNLGVLGLNLHFNSPESVNFFGAQSSLGGDTIFVWWGTNSILGGHGPGMPPVAPGLGAGTVRWYGTAQGARYVVRKF